MLNFCDSIITFILKMTAYMTLNKLKNIFPSFAVEKIECVHLLAIFFVNFLKQISICHDFLYYSFGINKEQIFCDGSVNICDSFISIRNLWSGQFLPLSICSVNYMCLYFEHVLSQVFHFIDINYSFHDLKWFNNHHWSCCHAFQHFL